MRIGIVGAGAMGAGIALAFAQSEQHTIVLTDIKTDLAEAGKARIRSKLSKLVEKGKIDGSKAERIPQVINTGERDRLADCDVVIEAIVERLDVKRTLFSQLQKICKKDAVFASNTSSLSVTEMADGLDRPVVGIHFFNPADVMALVEIVVGNGVSQELTDRMRTLVESIGKTPVEVIDSPGFIVNRILIPMINESIGILASGVASAEDIDTAMKLGANQPMGPLALGDLIGNDVCLSIMEVLHTKFKKDKYEPHPLLRKMVSNGLLGRKTGQGFFNYKK
jgi:3-hydroxybutyryl-CoA dehydrogenase